MSVLQEIAQKVKELMDELEKLQPEEKTEEFEYPFEIGDTFFFIDVVGNPAKRKWSDYVNEKLSYRQGNIFKTKQEVYKERDKRELLTKFRQFRDKCNGDWKPDFTNLLQGKYSIQFSYAISELVVYNSRDIDGFRLFGFFKELKDAERAIELFGDEIKRLFVEVE